MSADEWVPSDSEGEGEGEAPVVGGLPPTGGVTESRRVEDEGEDEDLFGLPPTGGDADSRKVEDEGEDEVLSGLPPGRGSMIDRWGEAPVVAGLPAAAGVANSEHVVGGLSTGDGLAEPPTHGHRGRRGRGLGRGRGRGGLGAPLNQKALQKRRMLKRRLSDLAKPEEPEAATMVCVWGGSLKHPAVVGIIWDMVESQRAHVLDTPLGSVLNGL